MIDWLVISIVGAFTGIASILVYKKISPQDHLHNLKTQQLASRAALRGHDGNVSDLYRLIGRDLLITLQQMRLILLPATACIVPCVVIMVFLSHLYAGAHTEVIYIGAMIIASLYVKIRLKII